MVAINQTVCCKDVDLVLVEVVRYTSPLRVLFTRSIIGIVDQIQNNEATILKIYKEHFKDPVLEKPRAEVRQVVSYLLRFCIVD